MIYKLLDFRSNCPYLAPLVR